MPSVLVFRSNSPLYNNTRMAWDSGTTVWVAVVVEVVGVAAGVVEVVEPLSLEAAAVVAAAVAVAGVSEYAAAFKMADNEYVKKMIVKSKDGKLLISSDASPDEESVLTAASTPDTFATTIKDYEAEITFGRAAGKVQTIKISVAGGAVVLTGTVE